MNQLYHPERTADFFKMLAQNPHIKVFTVTNNVVHDLTTYGDADKEIKTLEGVMKFLRGNGYVAWVSCTIRSYCFAKLI